MSFEGFSVKELKSACKEAVEDYLELCAETGKAPDKTYKGTFNMRVLSALHKEASIFASVHNITLNEFVKNALPLALQRGEDMNIRLGNNNQASMEPV